jgi:hypothetical protein
MNILANQMFKYDCIEVLTSGGMVVTAVAGACQKPGRTGWTATWLTIALSRLATACGGGGQVSYR